MLSNNQEMTIWNLQSKATFIQMKELFIKKIIFFYLNNITTYVMGATMSMSMKETCLSVLFRVP